MYEILKPALQFVSDAIEVFFAEVSIVFFLLGLVLILIGLFLCVGSFYTLMVGRKVDGVVVGAIKEIKIKEKEKKGKIEKQQDEWLSLIYEYNDLDGTTRQTKASNGGSSVLKYKTGQKVTLVIHHYKGEDEVYDADDKSSYVVGGILFIVGAIVTFMAASFFASLSISLLSLLGIAISMVIKGKNKKKQPGSQKPDSQYDLKDVRPVEYYVDEYKARYGD